MEGFPLHYVFLLGWYKAGTRRLSSPGKSLQFLLPFSWAPCLQPGRRKLLDPKLVRAQHRSETRWSVSELVTAKVEIWLLTIGRMVDLVTEMATCPFSWHDITGFAKRTFLYQILMCERRSFCWTRSGLGYGLSVAHVWVLCRLALYTHSLVSYML